MNIELSYLFPNIIKHCLHVWAGPGSWTIFQYSIHLVLCLVTAEDQRSEVDYVNTSTRQQMGTPTIRTSGGSFGEQLFAYFLLLCFSQDSNESHIILWLTLLTL